MSNRTALLPHLGPRALALLLLPLLSGLAPLSFAQPRPVIGGFDAARGDLFSLRDNSSMAGLRANIAAAFPASSITATNVLTPAYLNTLNVLLITSPTNNGTAITPLSVDEQNALTQWVQNGGIALLFADNDTFAGSNSQLANDSLLAPFGLHVTGTIFGGVPETAVVGAHPVINGPAGVVTAYQGGWVGYFDVLGAGTTLATLDYNAAPSLLYLVQGKGIVVASSDATFLLDGNRDTGANTLILNAIGLSMPLTGITLGSGSVIGGNSVAGNTVSISYPAPVGGLPITLASSSSSASVAATATVPAGTTVSAPFTIDTAGVAAATSAGIDASAFGSTAGTVLTINPASLTSVVLSPQSITGGNTSTANEVVLNGAAPPAGATASLKSANTAVATVPATVLIPGGARSAPFSITTQSVAATTSVQISAKYVTATAATLRVQPVKLASLRLSASTIQGGQPIGGNRVTLTGPAPAAGATVLLSSSNTAVARVAASITVAAGSTSSPVFGIRTYAVTTPTVVTITASYGGVTKTVDVTVTP